MNKKSMLIIISFTALVTFLIYGASFSCDYHIEIETDEAKYDGVCKFGHVSWLEESKTSTSAWLVNAWSISIDNNIFYLIMTRNSLNNIEQDDLNIYNQHLRNIPYLSYEYKILSESQIIIFSNFPNDNILMAKMNGTFSLFSRM